MCRESYEDAWYQLDEREQAEAVNEHIIMPEVVLSSPSLVSGSFPLPLLFIEFSLHKILCLLFLQHENWSESNSR